MLHRRLWLRNHCRFLNMLSVLESAIDLGTGRELPVVGFVNETMVLGVIVCPLWCTAVRASLTEAG